MQRKIFDRIFPSTLEDYKFLQSLFVYTVTAFVEHARDDVDGKTVGL